MNSDWESASTDVPFSVPFVHRLRFTRDVLGADAHVLADLLEPSGGQAASVQFWLDTHVAEAHQGLLGRIRRFAAAFAGRIALTGPVQIVAGGEECSLRASELTSVGMASRQANRRMELVLDRASPPGPRGCVPAASRS